MLIFIVGYLRVSSGGVDREVADTFRLVIRAGREECGINNTENSNQSTNLKIWGILHTRLNNAIASFSVCFGFHNHQRDAKLKMF